MTKRAALGVVSLALGAVFGCADDSPLSRGSPQISPDAAVGSGGPVTQLPYVSCVDSVAGLASLVRTAGLQSPDVDTAYVAVDSAWVPVALVDAATRPTGEVVLLDGPGYRVSVLDRDLRVVDQWGSPGQGPDELGRPTAVTFDASGDTIWLLDDAPPRLLAFDRGGIFQRTVRLEGRGVDLALDPTGRFVVSHEVLLESVWAGRDDTPVPLVSVFDPDGQPAPPLVTVSRGDRGDARFNIPGPVRPMVTSRGALIAVTYPAAAVIDVYEDHIRIGRARGCMPAALEEAYRDQMGAARSEGRQFSIQMFSDVRLGEDGLDAISVIPVEDGLRHIDRFDFEGRPRGSLLLEVEERISAYVRFVSSTELVTFDGLGTVRKYEVR